MVYCLGATAAVTSGLGFWGGVVNPTIVGPILLSVLFIGSTIFTESISSSKYPAYAEYRRTTSMLIPWPPRRHAAETV
jgi:steroid 5-alpha reductase family enzyme